MSRSIADMPSFSEEGGGPRTIQTSFGLPLEIQLWIVVSLLILTGLIMVYSASSIVGLKHLPEQASAEASTSHYLMRQLVCLVLGLAVMIAASRFSYRRYMSLGPKLLMGTVLVLVLVLMAGVEINNARRWFQLGIFLFQPAEFAKVFWVVFLSAWLVKKEEKIQRMSIGFWPPMIWCGVLGGLLLLEPDFGTTFVLGCLTFVLLLFGGVPFRHLFALAPLAALVFYQFVYKVPYRWERVTAYRNPWTDPLDSGYQLIQALIAVGSGGFWGIGLGASQQKLFYLPESFTDFILAVVGEELGFAGIFAITMLFVAFFRTGFCVSRSAPDRLGILLAAGLTMLISLQALLNMAVVLGLMPTKGLPLPFISYGGSAFTANCLAVGILMNIARSAQKRVA
jgi:cell division protein FtsW